MILPKKPTMDTSGATALEYTLIAAGISIVIVTGVALIGGSVSDIFVAVSNAFTGG